MKKIVDSEVNDDSIYCYHGRFDEPVPYEVVYLLEKPHTLKAMFINELKFNPDNNLITCDVGGSIHLPDMSILKRCASHEGGLKWK